MGRTADAGAGTGWLRAVCDDLLTTPHHELEPAAVVVEPIASVVYPKRAKRTWEALEKCTVRDDRSVCYRPDFPGLC